MSIENQKKIKKHKIAVVGLGYVGLSNAILLAQHNEVIGVDISEKRIELINLKQAPIADDYLQYFLKTKELDLIATTDHEYAYQDAEFIIISTPTNYNEESNNLDTTSIETVVQQIKHTNPAATIIIKSTIPIGYTQNLRKKMAMRNIIFSPEFLREGSSLFDNMNPSRIILGDNSKQAKQFAALLLEGAQKEKIDVLFLGSREAESVKLFTNSFLAMRVAFFNEIDNYALSLNMDSQEIIKGISLDPRIGDHYNNPSFGYGGYCLPKDTKQLLANFGEVPQSLIEATIKSNVTRKKYIVSKIKETHPNTIGIYRLIMKKGSDNYRHSAIIDVINQLKEEGFNILIYEPLLETNSFDGFTVEKNLQHFKEHSDIIVTNRISKNLEDISHKVFTRDLFKRD